MRVIVAGKQVSDLRVLELQILGRVGLEGFATSDEPSKFLAGAILCSQRAHFDGPTGPESSTVMT